MNSWLKERIKKYIGEILLVVGSFITTYNLFSFEYFDIPLYNSHYYYYDSESLLLLSLGVVMVVSGILLIKKINN